MTHQTVVPSGTRAGSHQQYDWVREADVMVTMRDRDTTVV